MWHKAPTENHCSTGGGKEGGGVVYGFLLNNFDMNS